MPLDWNVKRLSAFLVMATAVISLGSAAGAVLGFRFIGPGRTMQLLAQTDTFLISEVQTARDSLRVEQRERLKDRDDFTSAMRNVNIFICLQASPKDTALMDLNCEGLIGQARTAAIMRENDRAFTRPPWLRKP